eukprot:124092-Prymnesium_polylepis.1
MRAFAQLISHDAFASCSLAQHHHAVLDVRVPAFDAVPLLEPRLDLGGPDVRAPEEARRKHMHDERHLEGARCLVGRDRPGAQLGEEGRRARGVAGLAQRRREPAHDG